MLLIWGADNAPPSLAPLTDSSLPPLASSPRTTWSPKGERSGERSGVSNLTNYIQFSRDICSLHITINTHANRLPYYKIDWNRPILTEIDQNRPILCILRGSLHSSDKNWLSQVSVACGHEPMWFTMSHWHWLVFSTNITTDHANYLVDPFLYHRRC